MSIEILGGLEIRIILTKLGPKEVAKLGSVSHYFQYWASDDSIWSQICAQELHLYSPEDPFGNTTRSFKLIKHGVNLFLCILGPWFYELEYVGKGLEAGWLRTFQKLWQVATLRKGVTEDKLKQLEKCLKVKLPLPTRLLYRFCDGQDVVEYSQSYTESQLGLIGGYLIFEYLVNVYLLPLDEVIRKKNVVTHHLIEHVHSRIGTEYLVVAASSTSNMKFFLLNCSNGKLFVGEHNIWEYGTMSPCVPVDLIRSGHDARDCQQQDGLLLWLEEHGRRLESGLVTVSKERNIRHISLFPEESSLCCAAVTNGVQVRASAVFTPELSATDLESKEYCFAYSIRITLKPEGCNVNGKRFDSCQLYQAHKIIRENDNIVANVIEDTVVGKNPLLHSGEREFVYESCICLSTHQGSIEGSYTFVPGRLTDPKGAEFKVVLPRIFLRSLFEVPDYIF